MAQGDRLISDVLEDFWGELHQSSWVATLGWGGLWWVFIKDGCGKLSSQILSLLFCHDNNQFAVWKYCYDLVMIYAGTPDDENP